MCAAVGALADTERVQQWADLLTMLGSPHRLSILVCLRRTGEMCVSDLAFATGMTESAVSHALRLLRLHGLVAVRRQGRMAHYRLADRTAYSVLDLLQAALPSTGLATCPEHAVAGH